MNILRALSIGFFVMVFCFALCNQKLVVKYVPSSDAAADASAVVFKTETEPSSLVKQQTKPTFMQVEKINQTELPAQARIGYLLSRGF